MAQRSERPAGLALPTGTVAFLFTDVEGSSQRWDEQREAMSAALRAHDGMLREAIGAHSGYVFKTIGDAFCAAFPTAPQAVAAAHDAQRALTSYDWQGTAPLRVRMAIHAGDADERDGDYFGPAVNRVARLLAIGHGGQVLVSGVAADLSQGSLPPLAALHDLGQHRLRDLTRPEWVYQLRAPGLDQDFPKLRSLDALPNNLPRQLSSFVGRDSDLAEIKRLMQSTRLLTLVGTGGVGKTRAAIQAGADLLDGSGDGVWFVEFAPLNDAALVTSAVAAAVGVKEVPARPLRDTLLSYLSSKQLLLILDNCEHLVAEAAAIAGAILRAAPNVQILATSREGLGLAGETVFRMPSLTVPPAAESRSAEHAGAYGAIALFEARAKAANTRFVMTDENAALVTEICRRLDGIPLAIELAAARLKVLSVKVLAEKLDERFRLLTGGDRTAMPRQQTMRALIDWSYDLLNEDERAIFRRLGIFAGSFALDDAVAICADEALGEFDVIDRMSSLVEKSLVNAELDGDETRYSLLESTRQYAREKLEQFGELNMMASRHATRALELAKRSTELWWTMPDRAWIKAQERDSDNLRAAITWALSGGDVETGQRLVVELSQFFHPSLPIYDMRKWYTVAYEHFAGAPSDVQARLTLGMAVLTWFEGARKAAFERAEDAVRRFETLGDEEQLAAALSWLGWMCSFADRAAEGIGYLTRALELYRKLGLRKAEGETLNRLGMARHVLGDHEGAEATYRDAIALLRSIGADQYLMNTLVSASEGAFSVGNAALAERTSREALTVARALETPFHIRLLCGNLGMYLIELGNFNEARELTNEALRVGHRNETAPLTTLWHVQHLAAAAVFDPATTEADCLEAARLIGFIDHELAGVEFPRERTEGREYERLLEQLKERLTAEQIEREFARGAALTINEVLNEARELAALRT